MRGGRFPPTEKRKPRLLMAQHTKSKIPIMKNAEPLRVTKATVARVKRLAEEARSSHVAEQDLYLALRTLPAGEQAELFALYTLGWWPRRSFNVAVAAARKQNPDHIADMLAEKSNLATYLTRGLKRYARQS
jgi:Protein of unknown function (DUF3775)